MGSLKLPSAGQLYLDANAFVYSVEKIEPYLSILEPTWRAARTGAIRLVSSEIVVVEVLVKPIRDQDELLEGVYDRLLLDSEEVQLLPIVIPTLKRAAQIRAEAGLKTPDAIHAATALDAGVELFVTNDPAFRRVKSLTVAVLSEFLE